MMLQILRATEKTLVIKELINLLSGKRLNYHRLLLVRFDIKCNGVPVFFVLMMIELYRHIRKHASNRLKIEIR